MLFCHNIHYISMINGLFPRNFVVLIYAFFPPIFLRWKVVSVNFFAFWMYDLTLMKLFLIIISIGSIPGWDGILQIIVILSLDRPRPAHILHHNLHIYLIFFYFFLFFSSSSCSRRENWEGYSDLLFRELGLNEKSFFGLRLKERNVHSRLES